MAESAREFFEGLQARIDAGATAGTSGSYRFDIAGAGSWHVDIREGRAQVEESEAEADCVLQTSEETMMKIVRGEQNATTAFMTGKLKVKGDMGLAMKLQKLMA